MRYRAALILKLFFLLAFGAAVYEFGLRMPPWFCAMWAALCLLALVQHWRLRNSELRTPNSELK